MKTLDAMTVVQSIIDYAASPLKETRVVDNIAIGSHARQGDVYPQRIASDSDWKPIQNRQLAPGTTHGSRHTVDESVTVLQNPNPGKVVQVRPGHFICKGPQIVSKDRFTISHPEHADISLPAGAYQILFQVDPKSMQQVKD